MAMQLMSDIISRNVTEEGPAILHGLRGCEMLVKKRPVWVANTYQSSIIWNTEFTAAYSRINFEQSFSKKCKFLEQ